MIHASISHTSRSWVTGTGFNSRLVAMAAGAYLKVGAICEETSFTYVAGLLLPRLASRACARGKVIGSVVVVINT